MFTALLILQVMLGLTIIGLVLLQQGKGADMGAAFGSGASGTVFGARGSGSFFSRTTGILAAAFFANSLLLSSPLVLGDRHSSQSSVTETAPVAPQPETPAADGGGAAPDVVDLPPADLPEVDTPDADKTAPAADIPAVTEPAASTPAPKADKVEKPAAKAKAKDATSKDSAAGKKPE